MQLDCNAVINAAIDGDLNISNVLQEITPESIGKANNISRQGGTTQVRNLGSRISALRSGVQGLSFNGLDWRINGDNLSIAWLQEAYRSSLRQGGGASADSAQLDSKLGIFLTGNFGSGSKDESQLESGLDFDTYGLTMGVDYRITDQFILGSAFGYIDTQAELNNNAGDLDTQGYSLSLYGTYYSSGDYFVDFSATYGNNDFDQKRRIAYQLNGLTQVGQEFEADYEGDTTSLFIGSGYDFNQAGWTFGPRVDLEYIRSSVDSFSESSSNPEASGAGWLTRVEAMDQTWLTLNLGGRVSYAYSAEWGVLIPYIRLDWLHEFKEDSQTVTAHFVNDPAGQAIEITTDEPDRDYLRLRLGASTQFPNGLTGFMDFGTLLAHSQWSSYDISFGVRLAF
jgi:outer membrane autotransporter protein